MLLESENLGSSNTDANAPLVDVILITYNHEKFVAQAIESVLCQQTDFKFRLIVGDDCSTDNTQAIIRSFAEKHSDQMSLMLDSEHHGLKHKDRIGIKALAVAKAKYVAWLDGDDFWTDPNKLQKQVDFLERRPDFAICFHNARMFYENESRGTVGWLPADQREVSTIEDLFVYNFIPSCSVVFKRGLFGELPAWFFTLGMGDWPIHILNAEHGKIGYLNEVMATYRVHDGGAWSSGSPIAQGLEIIKMLDHVDAHFDFRYQRQVRAAKAEWYYELAERTYAAGKLADCRAYLSKHISLAGLPANRRTASLYLRAHLPGLYKALRSARGFLRLATEARAAKPAKDVGA
jgi:glycosyltransferase involved in cell wall biosynthesis